MIVILTLTFLWSQFSFLESDAFVSYQKSPRENFLFYSNLSIKQKMVKNFQNFTSNA